MNGGVEGSNSTESHARTGLLRGFSNGRSHAASIALLCPTAIAHSLDEGKPDLGGAALRVVEFPEGQREAALGAVRSRTS